MTIFKRLFSSLAPPSRKPAPSKSISTGLSATILNALGTQSIPSMAPAAQKGFSLATNPKASHEDFVELIESDEGLSSRILKIANSVYFERGKRASSVEECVTIIGMQELRAILSASTLRDLFPSRHPRRAYLWNHDVGTACVSKILAKEFACYDPESAFLAGLMHDIGKLLLLQRLPAEYEKVLKTVETTGRNFFDVERELLAFDHAEVGALIAERWAFEPHLAEAIANHHTVDFTIRENPISLSKLVSCADLYTHYIDRQSSIFSAQKLCEQISDQVHSTLREQFGVDEAKHQEVLQRVGESLERERNLHA